MVLAYGIIEMKKEDLKGKKVLVMGLGMHGGGVGTARFLASQGAGVTVTDTKTKKELAGSLQKLAGLPIRFVLGKHEKKDFKTHDLVIRNPGVPKASVYLNIARKTGVPVHTDGSLFLKLCPAFVIGITGTKGKSTITALIAEMLKHQGLQAIACGLPGTSLLEALNELTENHVAVCELSSWQLEEFNAPGEGPDVALITNIFPDHLKDYSSFDAYRAAKSRMIRYQNKEDAAVLNADDSNTAMLKKVAVGNIFLFSGVSCNVFGTYSGICIQNDSFILKNGRKEQILALHPSELLLKGSHNATNAASALAAIFAASQHPRWKNGLFDTRTLRATLKHFRGLEGRLEFLGTKKDILYVNDTAATNPGAVEAALTSFPKNANIILICGGQDKGLSYQKLAKLIAKRAQYVVLLEGSASDMLRAALTKLTFSRISRIFSDMSAAVKEAEQHATPGDMILLSPGAASFNLFLDEFDRGNAFRKAVKL